MRNINDKSHNFLSRNAKKSTKIQKRGNQNMNLQHKNVTNFSIFATKCNIALSLLAIWAPFDRLSKVSIATLTYFHLLHKVSVVEKVLCFEMA
jgi:hypothetical protein